MKNNNILNSKLILIPLGLASVVASVYLLQIVFSFLSQFNWLFIILIYAYIIYIIVAPIDRFIQRLNINPNLSLILAFIILFAVFSIVIIFINPVVAEELKNISVKLTQLNLNDTLNGFLNNIAKFINANPDEFKSNVINSISSFGTTFANNSISILSNALFTFVELVLAFIFGYFFVKDGNKWFKGFLSIIPRNYRDDIKIIGEYFNKSAVSFISVQVLMALLYGILNYIVMTILGIDFSLSASIIAFITFIIPGVGPILAMLVPVLVTALFSGDKIVLLVIILLVIQQIILNILIPKFYGNKVGVHPIIILLSILIGVQLFGIIGAFISIPLVAVFVNFIERYFKNTI